MSNIASEITAFIFENFLFGDLTKTIDPAESFLETGVVDSTGILELIAFSEENFGIEILDEEILPDNLDSINKLTSFITKKLENKGNDSK